MQGLWNGFHTIGVFLYIGHAKEVVGSTSSYNQVIIGYIPMIGNNNLALAINLQCLGHEQLYIIIIAEHSTDWIRNIICRQYRCGNLIQQWLEQMIVSSFNNNNINILFGQFFDSSNTAKTCTYNNNLGLVTHLNPS